MPEEELPPRIDGDSTETWRVRVGDKSYGPYTLRQMHDLVSDGRLATNSRVSKTGLSSWTDAANDPNLRQLLSGALPHEIISGGQGSGLSTAELVIRAQHMDTKSTLLAVIFSIVLPGSGYIYLGKIGRGTFVFVVFAVLLSVIAILDLFFIWIGLIIAIIIRIILHFFVLHDVYQIAFRQNNANQWAWLKSQEP
jgi:TM2 domain-containing membrane protein YozV